MALYTTDELDKILLPLDDENLNQNPLAKQIFGKFPKLDTPILRYVALMYDKNSPLRSKIPEISERKEECASLAGIKTGKEQIFDLSHEKIVGYINVYLRYQSSKIWAVLAANEDVLWQYQQELFKPITDFKNDKDKLQALEIKTKLMSECDAIIKRIESYEEKLFGDNDDKKEEILNYTPENIANI